MTTTPKRKGKHMKPGFLMIVLTLLENGQLSAAFVNTQTLDECEGRAAAVRVILEDGEFPVKQIVCRASEAQFEPFVHGTDEAAARQAYLVSFDDETAIVEPVAACEAAGAAGEGRYCATSSQKLLSQAQ